MSYPSPAPHGFPNRDDAERQLSWISGDLARIARCPLVVRPVRTIGLGILTGSVYVAAAYVLIVIGPLAVAAIVAYFAE